MISPTFNAINISLPEWPLKFRKNCINTLHCKKYVCYNQGRYIQFEYLLGLKHRDLKEAARENPRNSERISDYCENLLSFIHRELSSVTKKNFSLMRDYFKNNKNSQYRPRVCIKVLGENQTIVDLYREESYLRDEEARPHQIATNTGFNHVPESVTGNRSWPICTRV